jgi:hypothetical protein
MTTLHSVMTGDHDRLERLLKAALSADGTIDQESYEAFRRGLLRHIGIEERVLFVELRKRSAISDVERQLHRDHALLAALLMPPAAAPEIGLIRSILRDHDPLEEEPGGLYEKVARVAERELPHLMDRVQAFPDVPTAPHSDTPILRQSIAHLLREAAEGRRLLGESRRSEARPSDQR